MAHCRGLAESGTAASTRSSFKADSPPFVSSQMHLTKNAVECERSRHRAQQLKSGRPAVVKRLSKADLKENSRSIARAFMVQAPEVGESDLDLPAFSGFDLDRCARASKVRGLEALFEPAQSRGLP